MPIAERGVKLPAEVILNLEHAYIKVPFEQTRLHFRHGQRLVEKELAALLVNELPSLSLEDPQSQSIVVARLKALQERLKGHFKLGLDYSSRTSKRLEQVVGAIEASNGPEPAYSNWANMRVERMIVDYLCRQGLMKSAALVIGSSTTLSAPDYFDYELYEETHQIESSLQDCKTQRALAWCSDNRAALKRIKSPLEFMLRRLIFFKLLRGSTFSTLETGIPANPASEVAETQSVKAKADSRIEAIDYACKHFPQFLETFPAEVRAAMGRIAFPDSYFNGADGLPIESEYVRLIGQFHRDFYNIYSISDQIPLVTCFKAGLSVLRTPACGVIGTKDHKSSNINCPACVAPSAYLAATLPFSHHENSYIVCGLSGELLDDDNPPLVLPNGMVYGSKALIEMARKENGEITCYKTGEKFGFEQLKKAYIS